MELVTETLRFETQGHTDIVDLTPELRTVLKQTGLREGSVTIFSIGSTAGITTVEYEPGLVKHDLPEFFEQLAPYDFRYQHNKTWGDDNGGAHLRSSLLGSSLAVPFVSGSLVLGTWQQVVFVCFDTRPRSRKAVVQVTGIH